MKRGQEEIVGFVVVVVLIAVVALVFLSFTLRGTVETRQSASLAYFVEAMSEYTTNCSLYAAPDYASVGELYRACYQHTVCDDGTDSCLILNQTLLPLVKDSLRVSNETPLKGYILTVNVVLSGTGNGTIRKILAVQEGNCSTNKRQGSSDFRYAVDGVVRTSITTCS